MVLVYRGKVIHRNSHKHICYTSLKLGKKDSRYIAFQHSVMLKADTYCHCQHSLKPMLIHSIDIELYTYYAHKPFHISLIQNFEHCIDIYPSTFNKHRTLYILCTQKFPQFTESELSQSTDIETSALHKKEHSSFQTQNSSHYMDTEKPVSHRVLHQIIWTVLLLHIIFC